jgi:NAD(P)H-dependent flavin oxidoreductase YrpB (nitropropane dioxygenase family)
LRRPPFLAVISSDILAQSLHRSTAGAVDGFVVEHHTAGGHNAPPRGAGHSDADRLTYGPRDEADLGRLQRLDRPFWLAGGHGRAQALQQAQALGAKGIQVGTAFSQCQESGLLPEIKAAFHRIQQDGTLRVYTDAVASPTGFPFKIAVLPGTLSDDDLYHRRQRICNHGSLRQAYRRPDGSVGWRCPAEPDASYAAKGGDIAACLGRKCLCNALLAAIGHGQRCANGQVELPLLTAGDSLADIGLDIGHPGAADVVRFLYGIAMPAPGDGQG